ncbi:hypothetical protein BBJ29_009361 [Phytophthora kernoviae]|uniref:Pectinesterase n=1 Tax=Phytophthora kernoviae TaxID=325452 RepID=A0A421G915_9STRA|nr:hypothetical protein BBJ29_009361 [Phytophthora kernoviae]
MYTFAFPLIVLTGLATNAVTIANDVCSGPNARTQPPAGAIVVDATGVYNGSFLNVSAGVANLDPNMTAEQNIFVFPGVYHEQVFVTSLAGPLVLQGYTCDSMSYVDNEVTITQAKAQRDIPAEVIKNRNDLTSTVRFKSDNVKVYNLNVANTAVFNSTGSQALAINVNATDYGFYGCNLTGYQDTVLANNGRELFARSYIDGAVDFVFGQNATAWFESCDIEVLGKGYITANGRNNETNPSWYVFNRSRVFGNVKNGSSYLGRPWRPYARVVWQNSEFSDVINPKGWTTMSDVSKLAVTFAVGSAVGAAASALYLRQPKMLKTLPKLFVYDHCPYCVRARIIFGVKKIPHELIFLANHDEATPIGLVGSKQAPILQLPSGKAFPESMDIVKYVDQHYGGPEVLASGANRPEIKQWIKDTADVFRLLYHPRFHAAPFAEFAMLESREYYRIKKEKSIGPFKHALGQTPELVAQANKFLEQLATMFHSNQSVNEQLSYDDVDLFGRLRGLTLVRDLEWPTKLREYIDYMSEKADIPLLDSMAVY